MGIKDCCNSSLGNVNFGTSFSVVLDILTNLDYLIRIAAQCISRAGRPAQGFRLYALVKGLAAEHQGPDIVTLKELTAVKTLGLG